MMKIKVPPTVTIIDRRTGKPLLLEGTGKPLRKSFRDYGFEVALVGQVAGGTPAEQAKLKKIEDKWLELPEDVPDDGLDFLLEDSEHELVANVTSKVHYLAPVGTQTLCFPDAIKGATRVDSKSVAKPAEAAPEATA